MNPITATALALLAGTVAQPVYSQAYPVKPIRLVAPSSPGGTSDLIGRTLAQKLGEQLGQQVIVDNRAGAGGTIGYDNVAKSPADGYTLLIGPASIAINTSMFARLPYKLSDFAPISLLAAATNVLAVHPSLPVTSVKALIALARAKPGSLVAGSAGVGTSPHLSTELFKRMTNTDFVIVHYKGSGAQMIGLISGEHAFAFPTLPTVMPHLKQQRVRALAVSSAKRTASLPDLPTIAEAGVANYESSNWFSLVAPAGTPQAIIDRLHAEIVRAMRSPEVRDRIAAEGADVIAGTPDELAGYMKSESEKWAQVIKAAGLKAE